MTYYGIPFIFVDRTGDHEESDFTDIHDRMQLKLRCTDRDLAHIVYAIYDTSPTGDPPEIRRIPSIILEFGPDHSLGTIASRSGWVKPMVEYLTRLSNLGGSAVPLLTVTG